MMVVPLPEGISMHVGDIVQFRWHPEQCGMVLQSKNDHVYIRATNGTYYILPRMAVHTVQAEHRARLLKYFLDDSTESE